MATPRHIRTPLATRPADEFADDERLLRVRHRSDGYHWTSTDGAEESGPFELLEDALADMDGASEEAIERCEASGSIESAEQWPDTVPACVRRFAGEPGNTP